MKKKKKKPSIRLLLHPLHSMFCSLRSHLAACLPIMPQLHNERYEFHHSPTLECHSNFWNRQERWHFYSACIEWSSVSDLHFWVREKKKKALYLFALEKKYFFRITASQESEAERAEEKRTINYTSPSAADLLPSLERVMAVYVITVGGRVFLRPWITLSFFFRFLTLNTPVMNW